MPVLARTVCCTCISHVSTGTHISHVSTGTHISHVSTGTHISHVSTGTHISHVSTGTHISHVSTGTHISHVSTGTHIILYTYVIACPDLRLINRISSRSVNSGMVILGGGVVKHHICNANLMVSVYCSI